MCQYCDYANMLKNSGLDATKNRLLVLEIVGNSSKPISATDIFNRVRESRDINKVTVYRILDLLADNSLIQKIRMGGKAALFDLAPNSHHAAHPHFYCKRCGAIDCLPAESLQINLKNMHKNFSGRIDQVEIQIEGICSECLS